MRPETRKIYKKAFRQWDYSQVIMAIEEQGELIKALCKFWRDPSVTNAGNLSEEIADVGIMIEQLQVVFKCEGEVRKVRRRKLRRLKKLLRMKT